MFWYREQIEWYSISLKSDMRFLTCMADALIRARGFSSLRYFKTCLDFEYLQYAFRAVIRKQNACHWKVSARDGGYGYGMEGCRYVFPFFSVALEHRILTNPR